MNTSSEHIDDLIASYLAGEATPAEIDFVDRWKDESEVNRKYFYQMKVIFEKTASFAETESFSTDEAWIKVRAKLPRKDKPTGFGAAKSVGFNLYRIAAGFIILISAGIFWYQYFNDSNIPSALVLSDRRTEADTLPDGSGVFLNHQSKIECFFDRQSNTHTAKLTGEAYFTINHEDDKTFIVEAEGTFIKDIGTAFNVTAYPDSRTIEVVVEEGEVMFYTKDDPGIYLKANARGVYNKDTGKFTVAEPEPNVTSYKTKSFSFSNDSLETVVETLNEVYATQIQIEDRLKNCRLTVSFNDEHIEEIAHVIGETLGLTVTKGDSVITLKGSGCGEDQAK